MFLFVFLANSISTPVANAILQARKLKKRHLVPAAHDDAAAAAAAASTSLCLFFLTTS